MPKWDRKKVKKAENVKNAEDKKWARKIYEAVASEKTALLE